MKYLLIMLLIPSIAVAQTCEQERRICQVDRRVLKEQLAQIKGNAERAVLAYNLCATGYADLSNRFIRKLFRLRRARRKVYVSRKEDLISR